IVDKPSKLDSNTIHTTVEGANSEIHRVPNTFSNSRPVEIRTLSRKSDEPDYVHAVKQWWVWLRDVGKRRWHIEPSVVGDSSKRLVAFVGPQGWRFEKDLTGVQLNDYVSTAKTLARAV